MAATFEPPFESLRTYECPEWFRDVKFGIWSHWGPQSVPMCGEGHSHVIIEGFREEQVDWQDDDFRFVQKDGNVYAFIMKGDHNKTAVIKSLKLEETVKNIEYLGIGPVQFVQHSGVVIADLPDRRDTHMPGVLKISL